MLLVTQKLCSATGYTLVILTLYWGRSCTVVCILGLRFIVSSSAYEQWTIEHMSQVCVLPDPKENAAQALDTSDFEFVGLKIVWFDANIIAERSWMRVLVRSLTGG